MSTRSVGEVAAIYVAAVEASSAGQAIAPEFYEIWAEKVSLQHNFDPAPIVYEGAMMAHGTVFETEACRGIIPDYRHDEIKVYPSDHAFVLTKITRGTPSEGEPIYFPHAIVLQVGDGVITGIEAYVDREQTAAQFLATQSLKDSGVIDPDVSSKPLEGEAYDHQADIDAKNAGS